MDHPVFFSETPSIRIDGPQARVSANEGRKESAACSWTLATIRPGGLA